MIPTRPGASTHPSRRPRPSRPSQSPDDRLRSPPRPRRAVVRRPSSRCSALGEGRAPSRWNPIGRAPAVAENRATPAMERRAERIVAETRRYRIKGVLRLPRDGYRSRLTDYLNSSERTFIALTDVEVTSLDGGDSVRRHPFLALALAHVVLAMPA